MGEIKAFYILILTYLDQLWQHNILWTENFISSLIL
jgi:hypothetical protein